MKGYTYVMSDIHGRWDRFEAMLEKIKFSEVDTLHILGDVVDRGPDSVKVLKYIMEQPNVHMILGNHEDALLTKLQNYGFKGSYYDLGFSYETIRKIAREGSRRLDIVKFLKGLPRYRFITTEGERILLVHAGIQPGGPEQTEEDFFVWARDEFLMEGPEFPYLIIHGHTPVQTMRESGEASVLFYRNRINIDCGAPFDEGRLACIRLEDKTAYYAE